MTRTEAPAEVFWTASRVLRRKEQQAVLRRQLNDTSLRQDLIDLAVIESRRREQARSFCEYLGESRHSK